MNVNRLLVNASTEADWARKRLSDQISDGDLSAISAVTNLHSAIFAEAQVSVFTLTLKMQKDGRTSEEVRDYWLREVLNGADDRYSGRTNDAQRVSHEGVLRAVRKVVENI